MAILLDTSNVKKELGKVIHCHPCYFV